MQELLKKYLSLAMKGNATYGDFYAESSYKLKIILDNMEAPESICGYQEGTALRLVENDTAYLLHSDGRSEETIRELVRHAKDPSGLLSAPGKAPALQGKSIEAFPKISRLAKLAGKLERKLSPERFKVIYRETGKDIHIFSSESGFHSDSRGEVRLSLSSFAGKGHKKWEGQSQGGEILGNLFNLEKLFETLLGEMSRDLHKGEDVSRTPSGIHDIILSPGLGSVLFHEVCGHSLEGDALFRRTSPLAGMMSEKIGSDKITVIDDPSIPGLRGSYKVDDEGIPSSPTTLIEKGILRNFLFDRLHAWRCNAAPSGNGRRRSHSFPPLPRMSNTFLLKGEDEPEEILRDTSSGLYIKELGSGIIDPSSLGFRFHILSGYLIEKGKRGKPVRGGIIEGNALEVLKSVDRIGHDFKHDPGTLNCSKEGQEIPVSVGGPTVRIRNMKVRN